MRTLLFAAAATASLVAAAPASAQVYLGANEGGAGVQVGPFGFGVGPDYGWRGAYGAYGYQYADPYWNRSTPGGYANGAGGGYWGGSSPSYGYAGYGSYGYGDAYAAGSAYALGTDCPTIRERVVTRSGRVTYRTRMNCQ